MTTENTQASWEEQIADVLFKYHYPNMEAFLPKDSEAIAEIAGLITKTRAEAKTEGIREGQERAVAYIKNEVGITPDLCPVNDYVIPYQILEKARTLPTQEGTKEKEERYCLCAHRGEEHIVCSDGLGSCSEKECGCKEFEPII
jgi:hypothetical protein